MGFIMIGVIVGMIAVAAIGTAIYYVYSQLGNEQVSLLAPDQIARNVVKSQYQPSSFFLSDGSQEAHLGFGNQNAIHKSASWESNGVFFVALFGYSKDNPEQLIGYAINAYVQDPNKTGQELAHDIYDKIPKTGWKLAGPSETRLLSSSGISSIIYSSGHEKIYVKATELHYREPHDTGWPGLESVRNLIVVTYLANLPQSPFYSDLELIQQGDLNVYQRS